MIQETFLENENYKAEKVLIKSRGFDTIHEQLYSASIPIILFTPVKTLFTPFHQEFFITPNVEERTYFYTFYLSQILIMYEKINQQKI